MVGKDKVIILRMTAKDKNRIADAAQKQGDSITYFVTQAALNEAKKVLSRKEAEMIKTMTRPAHGGVPTFFRALCLTASQGGTHGYRNAGYHFGMATESEIPFDANYDEWYKMLEEVQGYIENEDRENIWRWYRETYPQALRLIPSRRKDTFVDGILEARNDGKLWFL